MLSGLELRSQTIFVLDATYAISCAFQTFSAFWSLTGNVKNTENIRKYNWEGGGEITLHVCFGVGVRQSIVTFAVLQMSWTM